VLVAPGAQTALPSTESAAPKALPASPEPEKAPSPEASDDWDEIDISSPEPPQKTSPPQTGANGLERDEEYFKDLSQDMYDEVGRLARRLSMSIRDVEVDKVEAIDFNDAGDQLEDAKDQLENVVKMTEKATLKIMDLGEEIQNSIGQAQSIMDQMNTQAPTKEAPSEDQGDGEGSQKAKAELAGILETVSSYLSGLDSAAWESLAGEALSIKDDLSNITHAEAAEPAAAAEPQAPQGPYYQFPPDLVFQTVYELCTNETVKKHIKAMWDQAAKGFDTEAIEKSLNQLVTAEPDEDNFLNLDLKGVLKALFNATNANNFKQVLKKMASTADQIFLDQFLPLEAMPADPPAQAAEAKPEPAPATEPQGPPPELLERLANLGQSIKDLGKGLTPPQLPENLENLLEKASGGTAQGAEGTNVVEPALRAQLDETMNGIFTSVNSIIEALSFQDLSGQTIYRIVRLLTDFQIQLLAMVVSFGSKIKAKTTDEKVTSDQSEKMAQEEVDKALSTLGVGDAESEAEEAAKLDQDSVNNLLESMGF
jgi:chemotaxis regulatin CheY-phosphate phosphatase CheZ